MLIPRELIEYRNHEFSSGCTRGSDYIDFEKKYIKFLKTMSKNQNWEIVNISKGHYEFSAFIKNENDKYVYLSISDVRFFPREWENHILIRTAKSPTDYTGGVNFYSDIELLDSNIRMLMRR